MTPYSCVDKIAVYKGNKKKDIAFVLKLPIAIIPVFF